MASDGRYYMYHTRGTTAEKHPYGWAVTGPGLDMYVPDKGLALAFEKFLNHDPTAAQTLKSLWTDYASSNSAPIPNR